MSKVFIDYLVKYQLNDSERECQTFVRAHSEEGARLGAEFKWPNDRVTVLSVERWVDKSKDLGECEECGYPLAKHCDSCEAIYCESCEYNR